MESKKRTSVNVSVILLSTTGSAILSLVIDACLKADVNVESVIIDGELLPRDLEINRSRLDPTFEIKSLKNFHYPKIPFYFVKNHLHIETGDLISRLSSDYILNAGTPRILKGEILKIKKGVLNCHPGLLPKYRGCTCVEWAIFNNDPVGATVYFMDENIDTGPIVLQQILDVPRGQSYELIRTRMLMFIAELMVKGVIKCVKENISYRILPPQSDGSYYKPIPYTKLIEVKQKLMSGNYESFQNKTLDSI